MAKWNDLPWREDVYKAADNGGRRVFSMTGQFLTMGTSGREKTS